MLSEHLFFITERITDILKFEKENESERITKQLIIVSLHQLHHELLRVVDYLIDLEKGSDEQQRDHNKMYIELRYIADSSDHILNCVFSNDVSDHTAHFINNLVDKIRNFHQFLPSTSTINYDINIVGNINQSGGRQIINYDPNLSRAPTINRISRPKTYGHVPNSDFVGFNHEIQTILTHLLQCHETRVVGVVGMGGVGKTTLAKQIYHHPQIRTHFNRKVWVCISQSWDKTSILNSIWRQATQDRSATGMDYDQALEKLNELLSSQSYLVILDDIWCINAWYDISPALPHNSGSKVVVTTRNKVVPKCIDPTVIIIEPKTLNEEESLELFRRRTFLPNENISHVLQQLGEKMVERCKGLPLAITALAGILRMDKSPSRWERTSKRLAHRILDTKDASTQGVVKEVLGLSYNELPHHLKSCALYLRLFPEDYVIESEVLMKMWIAECFIRTEEDDQISTANDYLDEMVQRCIIEVVETDFKGQVSQFRIHDLIREMFVDIDKKRDFIKDPLRLAPSITFYGDDQNINSFSIMSQSQSSTNLERIFDTETNSQVRSFICHSLCLKKDSILLLRLFEKFRLLRVLIMLCNISKPERVPEEIGKLIHLRYLQLGGFIQPVESIGNLVNLWTLDISNIYLANFLQINFNLCKLKELRHLYFPRDMPVYEKTKMELGRLKKLKTLWNVKGGEGLLSEMPFLSADLHELHIDIHGKNSKQQIEWVFRTPSIASNNLQTLLLRWAGNDNVLHDMNMLSKCQSLNQLKLEGAIKVGTPILFPPNLIKLEMIRTKLEDREVMNIISNSCPLLKFLFFGGEAYKGSELVCNANSFLQLENLTLCASFNDNLRLWVIETSAMPSLHHLTIVENEEIDVNAEGWTFISNIPQLTYRGFKDSTFAEKLRMYRKDYHNLSQSNDVYITNYHYMERRLQTYLRGSG